LVALPHTWNATDPFDDDQTYYRGIGWYRKTIDLDNKFRNKKVFLCFEGANQVAEVYVNGAFAGRHKGGYTAFTIDITPFLNWNQNKNENVIAVQVNNAHDNFIPPLSVGYALYGGLYRKMWLIATDSLHFKEINNSAGGVFISTPKVSKQSASFSVKTTVVNESDKKRTFDFKNTIFDNEGKPVASFTKVISVDGDRQTDITASSDEIKTPHLWSPEDPYLYHVSTQLIEAGIVVDEVTNPLGFRWFRFDADSGFFLNGKKYVLHGTNRHQDMEGKGSALTDEDHERDMHLIKEMGANFLRLAHYPQAPTVLNLADKLGIIIWEEIPVVNYMNLQPEFLDNAENMIREMIHQQYNHPAVVMWGSMNEILLNSKNGDRIQKQNDTAYLKGIRKFALKLDSLIRAEDPSRYTTMAMHGSDDYAKFHLDNISQVAGHNIYNGWYGGNVEEFGRWLDKQHKEKPHQIIFISEYGAGSDQRLNTSVAQRLDFTGQYQRFYHEFYLRQINARPYLAGTAIWNEFDFSQPNIGGPMSNQNNKGMMTWNRQYKDVYFLYKANWNPAPMIYIATRDWLRRAGYADTKFPLDVYANTGNVNLFVNGKRQGALKPDDIHKCSFNVQLKEGDNLIEAVGTENGKTIKDIVVVHYTTYPNQLSGMGQTFSSISINVGSNAQYTDGRGKVWLQDQPYKKGSYGYVSGMPSTINLKYMIKNTSHTPLYYSYLDNVSAYRVDVPDGTYEVDLSFLEPEKIQKGERIFDVNINQDKVIEHLDLAASYGFCVANERTFIVKVEKGKGLEISFNAIKGSPVLNGIKVSKQ
ncbi:MAG: glycoside hydrolase family 2 TIM barrel-domain containing protein, partial [Bacteroidota bacterium]|nr:glycoside hydrolase family 2 TIM barrel-domain containing protein [Bacteroidota bacterium]